MKTRLLAAGLALAALAAPAAARPVSYAGGWTLMQDNNATHSSLHVHYSPTPSDSVGLYTEWMHADDGVFTGLQYNRLLRRWNAPRSQANLYLKLGAGLAGADTGGDHQVAGFAGVSADWETRRYFVSYDLRARDYTPSGSVTQSARIGIAPYIAEFGSLHTWLMLQAETAPADKDAVKLTPIVRLFRGPALLEAGYTLQEDRFLLNWIYRF